jgi:lysine-N-methylase
MKLYAPKYYTRFACIADRCRHSCCIGWEIDVDDDTLQRYAALTGPYAQTIRDSIDTCDTPHFRLSAGERCPHLDERGLCRIILSCGEDCLCDICREHPRFYNDTPHSREVGLGMACEEACRLILSSDDYADMVEVGEVEGEPDGEWDTTPTREVLYALLGDEKVPYEQHLQNIYEATAVAPSLVSDEEWSELLASLEYLDDAHRELFSCYTLDMTTPAGAEKTLERALAYFIYRHCTEAEDALDYRAALGLCLFCERLLCSMIRRDPRADAIELARILSEEIEYSEDNTAAIKAAFEAVL